jgi:hypothetical protein
VTDLQCGPAYKVETDYGSWTRVWVPVLSRGRVRAVVKTSDVKDEEQLRAFCSRPDVTGVVTNDLRSLDQRKVGELKASYPGVDFYSLPVVEAGRRFPTPGSVRRAAGVTVELAALAAVTGLAALVAALRRRQAGRPGRVETAALALPSGAGSDARWRAAGPADGVTATTAEPVGAGVLTRRPAELPEDAATAASGQDLGALRQFFPADGLGVKGIGCGVYWLLLWGGIAAISLEQVKADHLYLVYCGMGAMLAPALFAIIVGMLDRRDSAALYAEGVVSWRLGKRSACRWDEVESVAGKLRVPGRSELGRAAETLRLRTADGRTVEVIGVKDMDNLVNAVYHEVLRRQLPRALAAIRRGETVSVGPLRFRSDGIGDPDEQFLAWDNVEDVVVRRDWIVVLRREPRGPWWRGDLDTPNAALILELMTACRRGELG